MNLAKRRHPYGIALLGALLWTGCSSEDPEPAPQLRPVRVERVTESSRGRTAVYAGVARAGLESQLSFRVSGTLVSVPVKVGDHVRKGEVLARVDSADFDLQEQQSEANLAQARASQRRALADYDRARALYENNNIARSDFDAARAAAESAQAQVEAAQKGLAQARQQVGYAVLRAPLDGAVAAVEGEINESVKAGQPIFLLTSGARPEVVAAVPEVFISRIEPGQPVRVSFDALPGRTFEAQVREVGVAALASSAFEVTARLSEASPEIRSGMAAEVTFELPAEGLGRVYVPPVAVGEDTQGRFVFILEAGGEGRGSVHRRAVEVGELAQRGLEVLSGLEPGELVVTAGVRRLSDGMAVKVLDPAETER
ncbi:MAG: efflux RND transporter periplasmic adaptor subunit [Acidobacteria bacterium]|nr:efflux RND transporter periplasmic adaptor subunit [Acidobacteriota bacterium]